MYIERKVSGIRESKQWDATKGGIKKIFKHSTSNLVKCSIPQVATCQATQTTNSLAQFFSPVASKVRNTLSDMLEVNRLAANLTNGSMMRPSNETMFTPSDISLMRRNNNGYSEDKASGVSSTSNLVAVELSEQQPVQNTTPTTPPVLPPPCPVLSTISAPMSLEDQLKQRMEEMKKKKAKQASAQNQSPLAQQTELDQNKTNAFKNKLASTLSGSNNVLSNPISKKPPILSSKPDLSNRLQPSRPPPVPPRPVISSICFLLISLKKRYNRVFTA
jgi:hypothetical protein